MQIIAKKNTSHVRFIAGHLTDISLRYNNIIQEFKENDTYTFFAEPIVAGNVIVWRTPLKGKIVSFNSLSDKEQEKAKLLLHKTATILKSTLPENSKINENFNDYLTIPSNEDIYLVKGEGIDKIVITNWGCISDKAGENSIRISVSDKYPVPVKFKLIFPNKTPAPGETIFITYNNIAKEKTSDENAFIDFGETNIGTPLTTHQIINKEIFNVQNFICDGRDEYVVTVFSYKKMNFVVKYDTGESIADSNFIFEYEDQKTELTSDAEGKIYLEKVRVSTKVKVYKQEGDDQKYIHNFTCEDDKDLYEIIIPKPVEIIPPIELEIIKNDFIVKLIDKKEKPISSIDIDFNINNEIITQKTDKAGYAYINNVEINEHTPIKYQVKYGKHKIPLNYRYKSKVYEIQGDKKRKNRKLIFKSSVERYDIMIKKRCLWCLIILLLLLMLLIRLNYNIDYVLINSCDDKKVAGTEIVMDYVDKNGDNHIEKKITDSDGEVSYRIKGRRIYEMIFGLNKIPNYEITAKAVSTGELLTSHTGLLYDLEKQTTELIIDLREEFVVNIVSKKDETFNISDATVRLKYYYGDKDSIIFGTSDTLGLCKFNIPVCTQEIELYGEKKGYSPDSIYTNRTSSKANPDKRKLKLDPHSYSLDIVMCIDATGSMGSLLNGVTKKSTKFYEDLKSKMKLYDKHTEKIRVRVIAYRDYYANSQAMISSEFFNLPEESSSYKKELKKIKALGGGDSPESGLEALSLAINSDWNMKGDYLRQIIVFWTDADAKALDDPKRKTCKKYPSGIPKDFAELSELWKTKIETASIVLFAPKTKFWTKINEKWSNIKFIENGGSISDIEYGIAVEEIAKEI